jgi:hypothetical protein
MKKNPRYEVVSIRLTEDRLALLERYRAALTDQLGRDVTIAEAAFLVLEDRAPGMDHVATRHELLQSPTSSLDQIRKRWASEHTLSAAQWDVLAEYVQIGAEEERQGPPLLQPAVPSRVSYLALLDAFEAVYLQRREPASRNAWAYFSNLGGPATPMKLSDTDADRRHEAMVDLIAYRRDRLQSADAWEYPGNIGRCLLMAIRDEGIDSTRLDQILAPYWPTLWGLAARGHWIRHDHRPVRTAGEIDEDPRRRITLPEALARGDVTVSLVATGTEFAMKIEFGAARQFGFLISQYPELVEFHAMLDGVRDHSWHGRYFFAAVSKDGEPMCTLWLRQPQVHIRFSARQWSDLRDLFREAWQRPELQEWVLVLQQEYGEQG